MPLNKTSRILLLCESPEKAKTISKIFKDAGYRNVIVQATVGHFIKIKDGAGYYNTGIYPDQDFKCDYIVDPGKAEVVKKLKEQVKAADIVYLCADDDREGSAIAWSCREFLKIPKSKYKRATYQAINQKAIFEALENAHDIDENLVNAAHSRSFLDKGLGYRLSTLSRQQGLGKSVGRVQSAALRMICDREREILSFVPEKYYELYLKFTKNGTEFQAKYQGTEAEPLKRLADQRHADEIFRECKGHDFIVASIDKKDKRENPKPPFSTATFQQECASKLGLTVKQSADCAQKLFDMGYCTYLRTDSEVMAEGFVEELQAFVLAKYGKDYLGPLMCGKVDKLDQGAHECFRVLDLNMTPEKFADTDAYTPILLKVYRLIYNRTIQSTMKPAIYSCVNYIIGNGDHRFSFETKELTFKGYKIVNNPDVQEVDDDDQPAD